MLKRDDKMADWRTVAQVFDAAATRAMAATNKMARAARGAEVPVKTAEYAIRELEAALREMRAVLAAAPQTADAAAIRRIIDVHCYEGIRDQDGWETLTLTVRNNHPRVADAILEALKA